MSRTTQHSHAIDFIPYHGNSIRTRKTKDGADMTDAEYLGFLLSAIGLVLMAGIMSGLTLGLMSLDEVEMEILEKSGKAREKICASKIRPLIQHPHRLLVTLVVWNAIAAEALPLVLDRITDPITAVILSVTVVLLFGEIVPQALCSNNGLEIGAFFTPLVKVLIVITAPISGPIAFILDTLLGQRHTALFRRAQLKTFVDMHDATKPFGGNLSAEEIKIIKGALDLTHKRAKAAMTPMSMVFMLPMDAVLDEKTLTSILESGHSRILVHKKGDRSKIVGLVLVKELILVDPHANQSISSMRIRHIPHLLADTPMYDMLRLFKSGGTHMVVLTQPTHDVLEQIREMGGSISIDSYSTEEEEEEGLQRGESGLQRGEQGKHGDIESLNSSSSDSTAVSVEALTHLYSLDLGKDGMVPIGILTIEDVLEELLGDEIIDETDTFVDNYRKMKVNKANLSRALPPYLRKALRASPHPGSLVPGLQIYRMPSGSLKTAHLGGSRNGGRGAGASTAQSEVARQDGTLSLYAQSKAMQHVED